MIAYIMFMLYIIALLIGYITLAVASVVTLVILGGFAVELTRRLIGKVKKNGRS